MDERQRKLERLAASGDADAALRLRIINRQFAVGDVVICVSYGGSTSVSPTGCEGIVIPIFDNYPGDNRKNFVRVKFANMDYGPSSWLCHPGELMHRDEKPV